VTTGRYRPAGTRIQYRHPIDMLAGRTHFLDHLAAIWQALPADRRGTFWIRREMEEHAAKRGIMGTVLEPFVNPPGSGPVVVSAYSDLERVATRPRPLILMEHGCGLSFPQHHAGYAGGEGLRAQVGLFIAPNEITAAKTGQTYPYAPQVVAGTPKLDRWHRAPGKAPDDPPTVAISFHWESRICPEAGNAWAAMKSGIPALAAAFPGLIGHGHPKIVAHLRPAYEAMGIAVEEDFEEVLRRADIYICDASSTLYEFASLDRPVVVMNSPAFRRQIHYGVRFWLYADVGVECNRAEDLVGAVRRAIEDPPDQQFRRRAASAALYPNAGHAAEVAAEGIVKHCEAQCQRT